jgi:hypothetical protein
MRMAVNNQVSTARVREAADYFNKFLKEKWKVPEDELEVADPAFGLMAKEATYAASLFLNPVSRGVYSIHLQEQKIDTNLIPDLNTCRHIITTVASYSTGIRKFPRPDIQELGIACDSLVKCIEALERKK